MIKTKTVCLSMIFLFATACSDNQSDALELRSEETTVDTYNTTTQEVASALKETTSTTQEDTTTSSSSTSQKETTTSSLESTTTKKSTTSLQKNVIKESDQPAEDSPTPNNENRKPFNQGNVNWSLVKSDDFNGNSLDNSLWENGWYPNSNGWSRPVNDLETACYNRSQTTVSGGKVIFTMRETTQSEKSSKSCRKKNGSQTNYVSGYINSRNRFEFGPGTYVEALVNFPGEGKTLYNWSQVWTADVGQAWPQTGEFDIAEVLSGKSCVNFHFANPSTGKHNQAYSRCTEMTAGPHRVAMKWNYNGTLEFYYDGKRVKDRDGSEYLLNSTQLAGPRTKDFKHNLIIGFSMPASNKPGYKVPTNPLKMTVDYVDVYKL